MSIYYVMVGKLRVLFPVAALKMSHKVVDLCTQVISTITIPPRELLYSKF